MKRILLIIFTSILTLLAGYIVFQDQREVPLEEVFPGKIWVRPIENLPDLKGVGAPTAKNCGNCHSEIYEEWKLSTHANALSDIQFQSELAKPSSPKWICLNCHIPLQNQRETIVTSLRGGNYFEPIQIPNPKFNAEMKEEAITCATCHVRVDSNTNESYVIGGSGDTSPPHPIKINREFLQNRCNDCHNETYTLNESLICSFQTGTELKSSQSEKTCANCHMPEIRRSFVKPSLNRPNRNSHRHGFVGGGVPKSFALYKEQVRLGYKPGIVLTNINFNEESIILTIENQFASHYVTSGDPERFYRFKLDAINQKGEIVQKEEIKIGQEWEWSPKAKKVSDNRIHGFGKFEWKVDWKQKNPSMIRYRFQAIHVRLKNNTSDYMQQSAENVPLSYREKVKHIQDLYPHSSIVLESVFDNKGQNRRDTKLEELFLRNAERKGE
ncbi:cytochrome c554 and C-prime [Leptospira yanagawae serovar Saopaulo str. Sao Paulo = ATCC 700523]|uniref:Cytochrome c554 and C-prime n=1 Tax=Leptospira yanagawae serovar Saopaulo str. Sao Paulo = ATCC 700523 TaxID=1249483 RepID=A0A5E8H9F1_9LEPT|nr:multiheme c-type cytochrome [Leptospira yanagawae]EOQ87270.1 cytochrome c554 and C-prime [Leptospira yanagawae serovar Saopaulo str. Sao Paulo = ATCC 700523]